MVKINFKEGFKRIFLVITIVIILVGVCITFSSAWQETNNKAISELSCQCISIKKYKNPFDAFDSSKNISPTIESQIKQKYLISCETTKPGSLNSLLANPSGADQINEYNFITGKGSIAFRKLNSQSVFADVTIPIDEFLKYLNLKLVHKNWYEYITFFISKTYIGLFISFLISGLFYCFYLLLTWIFSGFSKTKSE